MEKVIVALWAFVDETHAQCGARLLQSLPAALAQVGIKSLRINVLDEDVAAGAGLVQRWQEPQQAAIVQFWMPSANAMFRSGVDAVLAAHGAKFAAWLVCESTVIANTDHPAVPVSPGQQSNITGITRTWGFAQASFISFRPDLPRSHAMAHWHSHHTRVAIETQSNFEYVQNIIVRPLTDDAPAYDAFVEECFPIEALDQPEVFFDAAGQPEKFSANLATMMDSCAGFIDFTRIDVIPTSQYDF